MPAGSIQKRILISLAIGWLLPLSVATSQIRLPAIDPTGNRIFLPPPNSTTLLGPRTVPRQQRLVDPYRNHPVAPAFTHPPDAPPCESGNCQTPQPQVPKHVIPNPRTMNRRGRNGEIIMTPSRIIAPVNSEVVVLAGICGGDGYYVTNQPLEWMLSNDSVGQFIEVGGMDHKAYNRWVPPSAKKFDGSYAWGRTGTKERLLTRGTPTPADDIYILDGQAYISVSSASEGTSYVTCVAPKAAAWDKRRASTIIHWVDAVWSIPIPARATAGTVHPLTTLVKRSTDGNGVPDWKVRYTIVGGAPAEFAPTGSQTAEVTTGDDGLATVQLRQVAGQFDPGTTQIRIDVIRPRMFGQNELTVESAVTSVTWSAPALTLRAIGPRIAGVAESFNYRIEVSNPGDQVTRNVVLSTKDFSQDLEFISSDPKPAQYGQNYQWQLGDIAPGAQPKVVNIQLRSMRRGNVELCFEVNSRDDRISTEACAQTEIAAPCIGLQIEGPTNAKVGDQAEFSIAIVNQCNEAIDNVRVEVQYDTGLVATGLGNPIGVDLGRLEPDQRRTLPLLFDVTQPGTRCFNMTVTADGGHTARARRCIEAEQIARPEVTMKLEGIRAVEVGDRPLVRALLTNTGNQPVYDITVTNRFSESLEPREVTQLYRHSWLGDDLAIQVGQLDPGESATVEVVYEAMRADPQAFSEMTVSAPTLEPRTERFPITITPAGALGQNRPGVGPAQPTQPGTGDAIQIPTDPAAQGKPLSIQLQPANNTIAVGGQATYRIQITNVAPTPDRNVDVTLLVPPGLRLVDFRDLAGNLALASRNSDFTEFYLDRRMEMRAGETMQFEAVLEGVQPGNYTFEVQATSSNSSTPVTGTSTIVVQ